MGEVREGGAERGLRKCDAGPAKDKAECAPHGDLGQKSLCVRGTLCGHV